MIEEIIIGDEEVKKLRHLGDVLSICIDKSPKVMSGFAWKETLSW